jgi:hypothetical protein
VIPARPERKVLPVRMGQMALLVLKVLPAQPVLMVLTALLVLKVLPVLPVPLVQPDRKVLRA